MAHRKSLTSEIDQSSHSLDLEENQKNSNLDTRCCKSTSAILNFGPDNQIKLDKDIQDGAGNSDKSAVLADTFQVIPDSIDVIKCKQHNVACQTSGQECRQCDATRSHADEPTEKSPSNSKAVNTKDDQTRASLPDASPTEAEKQFDISIDLMPYTTEDLKEALSEIYGEVHRFCSSPDHGENQSMTNKILASADSSLMSLLGMNKEQENTLELEGEGTSNGVAAGCGNTDQSSSTNRSPVGHSGAPDEITVLTGKSTGVTAQKFMGELLSPRDADIHDLSDHEIVSNCDLVTEIENGQKSPERETETSGPRRKTVRFILDENDSPSEGLSKKVSGIFSSSSSSLLVSSSSSSTSDFGNERSSRVEPIIEEVSDSSGPGEGGAMDYETVDAVCELPSPRIYFTEKELPLISCPNQEQVFELEDIIPKEISASTPPPGTPETNLDNSTRRISPDELLFAPVEPFVEIPVCDGGCVGYYSEITPKKDGEERIQTGTNADETASSQQPPPLSDLRRPFAVIDPDPYLKFDDVECFNSSFIQVPEAVMYPMDNNVGFPDEVDNGQEGHPGSFTASDLPMTIPTAFQKFHSRSEDSLSEGGRCSSGSMDVMPSESNESLTTATETCSTTLEGPDPDNLIGVTPPIVLKRSLHYLSQIHQLEKMVQDGKRHVQALQEDCAKREQEYEAESLALRQSLQRELEESRTQGWMVEKRLTEQVKCLTADNAALMRQVNHSTNRMQEFERINTTIVAQYHNALSTVQAMEKDHKSAQRKIRELRGKLGAERQAEAGSEVNVDKLLKEKQEILQSVQKLEERLIGQKDINTRLLSEIEKMTEEKRKEAERIKEEKEREFRISIDQLRNKLDLQTARLRKEHSTTEILKAEFTSIRRDLESQIAARDVKIEELRRHIRTEIEAKKADNQLKSEREGDREKKERGENSAEVQEELKKKESEIRVLENALTDENKKFVDLQASLKEKEVQLTMLQEDMECREQLLEDATESCRRLKRQKSELDEQVQNQGSEIVLLREYLSSRDRRIVQMAADLSRRDRRIMTLLKDLQQQSSSKAKAKATATGAMTSAVKDSSSSSSSPSAPAVTGKTDEGSLSDHGCDDHKDRMDEAIGNFKKVVEELKQYKSDAENRIQDLQKELGASERHVAEMERLQTEMGDLQDYVKSVEKDAGIEELSQSFDIIKRLQTVFQTKENGFTIQLDALQEINRDMKGMMMNEREKAETREDKMSLEKSQNEKLKLEVESYRTALEDLREELAHSRQTAETQIDSLTSLLTSYKQHIDSQQLLRQDADQMVGHYISENTQLKARLDQSSLEHENMAKELAAAEKLKSYCILEKERLEKEFEDTKTKLDYIKSDNLKERDKHKTIVDDLSQKLDQKCSELLTTSNNLEQVLLQVGHASEHAQELSRRLGEREDEIHELNVRLLQLDGQRNRIEAEKTVLENQCDVALQKIEDLETARTESKETIFQNEGKTEELIQEINDLKLRLSCEMNNYEHLKTLHLNLEEKNRGYIEQIHQLQTEMVNLKGQWAIRSNDLEKMKETKDQLENELKSQRSQSEDMKSRMDELEQQRETDHKMYVELKDERDSVLQGKEYSQEQCRRAEEKIERMRKTLKLRKNKIAKLQQERANQATQEVETSSTTNPVETEERGQQTPSREERDNVETLQQQHEQERQQQLLRQELQRNRMANIAHDINELQECLTDSRLKLTRLTENQEALYEENEWLTHELEAINAALEDEKTQHQEAIGRTKKVIGELKHKRVELHKAKRELRSRSRANEQTMSTLNQTETIRNDLSQENSQLVMTCREKDAQITLLHEIIKSHQDKTSEQEIGPPCEPVLKDCEHDSTIRELERKLEEADGEIRSIKARNCRLNIDMQVKCDYLTNQKAECTRLQATTYDLQQINWDLKQKLGDVKHKLQTEKQVRKLLEQRYDDELNDIKTKSSFLEDRKKERGAIQSKEIQRKLSKLEQRLQTQEVQPVNISDDQRQIHGLKSEIEKLGTLRDLDRQALDDLSTELGAVKSLMTSEIQRATNHNSANQHCRSESRASRLQQALRRAELSAIRMTSFPNKASDNLFGLSDDLPGQSDDLPDHHTHATSNS